MSMKGAEIEREKNRKALNMLKGLPIDHGKPIERVSDRNYMYSRYRTGEIAQGSRELKPTGKGGKCKWPRK